MPIQGYTPNQVRDMRQVQSGGNGGTYNRVPEQQQQIRGPSPTKALYGGQRPGPGQQQQTRGGPTSPSYSDPRQPQNQQRQAQRPKQQPIYNTAQQRSQQYPPPRPQLQVNVTAPQNPFVDPPRAAFVTPPSPALSSSETLIGSPKNLAPKNLLNSPSSASLIGSATSNPDNDRLAPARLANGDGPDFWKRFSMVAHEAEMEKQTHPESGGKDPWLSKHFRGSKKFTISVWAIGLICIAAIGGSLGWHFTHNNSSALTTPSQHDFGLGGTSSVARTGFAAGGAGGGGSGTLLAGAATAQAVQASADADLNLASAESDTETMNNAAPTLAVTSTTRRASPQVVSSTIPLVSSTSTRARSAVTSSLATSSSARATAAKRMHQLQRRTKL